MAVTLLTGAVFVSVTAQVSYSRAFFEVETVHARGYGGVETQNSQTLPLLQAARNLDPNPARGGGDILMSNGTALVADASPFNDAAASLAMGAGPDQISLYLVREGDTLSQVATMFNVSVSTIVWANELTSSRDIHPGETLLILPVSGVQYTVKKGDTLQRIATEYSGDKAEIIAYNNLPEDGTLTAGSVITIPGGEVHIEKPQASSKKVASSGGAPASGGSGYYTHPLPGSVRTQGLHGYNGIDFGAPAGTPIYAAAKGTVIVSKQGGGWNGGYGNYVVIDHPNGTQTLYAHTTRNAVALGASVSAGQVVGYVGNTGRSTGNHLHFEIRGAKNPF